MSYRIEELLVVAGVFMIFNLFLKIFVLFLMMGIGVILRKQRLVDDCATKTMAGLFMKFFYPCLIFVFLVKNFTVGIIINSSILPIGVFLIMFLGYLIGYIATKFITFKNNQELRMFNFQYLLNNYSFLPLPIILMLFGESLASKHLFATLGAEVMVWTVGVLCLTGSKFDQNFWKLLKKMFSLPVLAMLFSFFVIIFMPKLFLSEVGSAFFFVIETFGKATIPIAMIVAGSRLAMIKVRVPNLKQIYLVILRLVFIPLIVFLILKHFYDYCHYASSSYEHCLCRYF
ncbi:MAG: hypothetical protein GY817_05390 [bacterium]|nr:hypothetical protein [bacterium]